MSTDTTSGEATNSLSASASDNSLKSLLKSKGGEIKGKNGAKYQRHGSFCINSLGLPAEDIGVSLCVSGTQWTSCSKFLINFQKIFENHILIPGRNYEHRIIYKFGTVDQ